MVINHLDKLFVTSDASTIINEMEVQHPAAKLVVFASQAQEQEIGDGTNFVSIFGPPSNPLLQLIAGALKYGREISWIRAQTLHWRIWCPW